MKTFSRPLVAKSFFLYSLSASPPLQVWIFETAASSLAQTSDLQMLSPPASVQLWQPPSSPGEWWMEFFQSLETPHSKGKIGILSAPHYISHIVIHRSLTESNPTSLRLVPFVVLVFFIIVIYLGHSPSFIKNFGTGLTIFSLPQVLLSSQVDSISVVFFVFFVFLFLTLWSIIS